MLQPPRTSRTHLKSLYLRNYFCFEVLCSFLKIVKVLVFVLTQRGSVGIKSTILACAASLKRKGGLRSDSTTLAGLLH